MQITFVSLKKIDNDERI